MEGTFDAENKKEIKEFLKENDFDADDELVVRREIGTNGKSRAFINDTPVNLSPVTTIELVCWWICISSLIHWSW